MYLRHKHDVSNATRDAGVVLHTEKISSSLYGGKTFGPGWMEAERAQIDGCKDDVPGRGVAGHFFLFSEPSDSGSVWTGRKRAGPPWRSPGF